MRQHQVHQFPVGNKYLQQKWDNTSYDLHRHNVQTAKSTINITAPKTYGHLALKLKKQKIDEDKKIKIQRENNLLLEKIAHIVQTTGAVDNVNYYEKKSLNMQQRQAELLRITHENQHMQQRLSQCKSHYNVKSWHQDWIKTMGLMDSITQYPRRRANTIKSQEKHLCKEQGRGKIQRKVDKPSDSGINTKESKNEENLNETNTEESTKQENLTQNVTEPEDKE